MHKRQSVIRFSFVSRLTASQRLVYPATHDTQVCREIMVCVTREVWEINLKQYMLMKPQIWYIYVGTVEWIHVINRGGSRFLE